MMEGMEDMKACTDAQLSTRVNLRHGGWPWGVRCLQHALEGLGGHHAPVAGVILGEEAPE